MQRILLVAAVIAAGLTGCANPAPYNKPFTPIGPAPLQPPRPDMGNGFPTAPGSPSSSFPDPRNSSSLNQPSFSNPNAPQPPPPNFPTGPTGPTGSNGSNGFGGSVSNSSFVPRSQNLASAAIETPPGAERMSAAPPSVPTSDFSSVRVGAPTYNPGMPSSNQNLGVSQPPPYGPMSQSVPLYAQPPSLPPPLPNVNVMAPIPSAPPISASTGVPTTYYPGVPLRGN